MRTLLGSESRAARLAIDLYVYRIGRELGSLAAALGGLDAIVFTGGIGENSAEIRERDLPGSALARRGAGRAGQPERRAAHQPGDCLGQGMGGADERGADDRGTRARAGLASRTHARVCACATEPQGQAEARTASTSLGEQAITLPEPGDADHS
jgi:hypothetical protein